MRPCDQEHGHFSGQHRCAARRLRGCRKPGQSGHREQEAPGGCGGVQQGRTEFSCCHPLHTKKKNGSVFPIALLFPFSTIQWVPRVKSAPWRKPKQAFVAIYVALICAGEYVAFRIYRRDMPIFIVLISPELAYPVLGVLKSGYLLLLHTTKIRNMNIVNIQY